MDGDARAPSLRLEGDSRTASFRLGRLCQRDDDWRVRGASSQFGHLLSHSSDPLSPFSFSQSRRYHLSSQNARMNRSIPHIPPSAIRRKITRRSLFSRDASRALYIQLSDIPPSHRFYPNIYFWPLARAFSHSAGHNRTADCRAWAPCISAPNLSPRYPRSPRRDHWRSSGPTETPPCLVLAYNA